MTTVTICDSNNMVNCQVSLLFSSFNNNTAVDTLFPLNPAHIMYERHSRRFAKVLEDIGIKIYKAAKYIFTW